ncbi:ribonuclease R [Alkanindiges sp. WGS2144]|uniref:ribonuclease R n=1 Tax=Alkanindiges sp. WGS2144 TaxID=3366808 RepID=UPI003753CD45
MNWQDPDAEREAKRYDSPIPSRTLIQQTIAVQKDGFSHAELVEQYQLEHPDAIEALSRRLAAMVRDGQLARSSGYPPLFRVITDEDLLTGRVQSNSKGFGFVVLEDQMDIFLPEREMRLVFNGDLVKVRQNGTDRRGRMTGYIVEVLERQQKELIGKVIEHEGEYFVQPAQPNAHQPVALEPEQIAHAGLRPGDSTQIAIDEWPSREEFANGHIIANLADKADSQLIIPATILDFDLPFEFSADALAEATRFKEPAGNEHQNRVDLRDLPLVTIDGEDARDFDDAVYAEKRVGGGYRLVVAIADVSHYVRPGSALDDEAQERGTSVYFPNHVIPMLPEALSNGLCSLMPQVDRLCMVCDIKLSRLGRITGYEFYPAVMHSQARLTYTQVAAYLHGQTDALPGNAAVRKSVNVLFQLFQTLLKVRQERGAMEFETIETYMTFDELGAIREILPRVRNDAHRLIEECMLLANVCASDFALSNDLPILFRNHEAPEPSRVQKVRDYVRLLGFDFPEKPTQADYQDIIEKTRDRIDATSIHAVLLRSMMQAYYGPKNLGHYGLAYEAYTHFTSPIRRYPDLLLHRAIKAFLRQKPSELEGQALAAAGEHYSQTERRADEASRSVVSWLKCHYMEQHIGEEFDGTITAVTDFGLFVTLSDLYVDGMLHISQLGDDYFVFDGMSQSLVGQQHAQRFSLGDQVRIKVLAVHLEDRKIDFALVKQLSSQGRALRQKAPRQHTASSNTGKTRPVKDLSKESAKTSSKKSGSKSTETAKKGKPKMKKSGKKPGKSNAKPRAGY